MARERKKHLFFHIGELGLPLVLESIGFNPEQERIDRPDGYPYFHWLQTVQGEGTVEFEAQSERLPKGRGVLFLPRVPHRYHATVSPWATRYLTFTGASVDDITTNLNLRFSAMYRWTVGSEFDGALKAFLNSILASDDISGLRSSLGVYRFLVLLKVHCRVDNTPSLQSLMERLAPLVQYLQSHYSDPDLGVPRMAEFLNISTRQLNSLFQRLCGTSPYHYLLHYRVAKGKELLLNRRSMEVKEIAFQVGFRSVSHFIQTFSALEGNPPERFRKMHL